MLPSPGLYLDARGYPYSEVSPVFFPSGHVSHVLKPSVFMKKTNSLTLAKKAHFLCLALSLARARAENRSVGARFFLSSGVPELARRPTQQAMLWRALSACMLAACVAGFQPVPSCRHAQRSGAAASMAQSMADNLSGGLAAETLAKPSAMSRTRPARPAGAAHAADWPGLAEARGSPRPALALNAEV